MERWKTVGKHPDYAVSTLGRVKRIVPALMPHGGFLPMKILSTNPTKRGYVYVLLSRRSQDAKRKFVPVHRLVLTTFIRPPRYREEANHLNCVKSDNRLENLEWTTRSKNALHASKNGRFRDQRGKNHWTKKSPHLIRRGERNAMARLTEAQVRIVLSSEKRYGVQTRLAKQFNVTVSAINNITRRIAWTHIA